MGKIKLFVCIAAFLLGNSAAVVELDGEVLVPVEDVVPETWTAEQVAIGKDVAHGYIQERVDLWHIHRIWHSIRVEVQELEHSCPLEVTAVQLDRVSGNRTVTGHGMRRPLDKKSVVEVSPFGPEVKFLVQCKEDRLHLTTSGHYTISISSGFRRRYPGALFTGIVIVLVAPELSHSKSALYTGGITLSVTLLLLVLIYQIGNRMPGGKLRKGALLGTFWLLPVEIREFAMREYFSAAFWPGKCLYQYLNGHQEGDQDVALAAAGAAMLALWISALLGCYAVNRMAINHTTGKVADGAAEFVCWSLRVLAIPFLLKSSADASIATAITVTMGALFVPPGSWIVAWIASSLWFTVRFVNHCIRFLRGLPNDSPSQVEYDPPEDGGIGFIDRTPSPVPRFRSGKKDNVPPSPSPVKPMSGWAANAHGRWLTEDEYQYSVQDTTRSQLELLTNSAEFVSWVQKNANRIRVEPEHNGIDLSDQDIEEVEDNEDEEEETPPPPEPRSRSWRRR